MNAQFNVDTSRAGILHDEWNEWLLDQAVELVVAVSRLRFQKRVSTGWRAVPLVAEAELSDDEWLRERLISGAGLVQSRILGNLRFEIGGTERRLRDLVFEEKSLERLLGERDLALLHPGLTPFPRSLRDRENRWRKILAEVGLAREVVVADALRLLDLDDLELGQRPVNWFIRFTRAVISAERGGALRGKR